MSPPRLSAEAAAKLGIPLPSVGKAAPCSRKASTKASNDLVASCLDMLAAHRVVAWRNATTGVWDPAKKRFRTFTGRKGVSDILGLLPPTGRLVAIECKSGTGRLTPDQRQFLADVVQAGGIAIVARSVEDVAKALREAA